MLFGQVLNSQTTLNNFKVLGTKEFFPGEQFTLYVRIIEMELALRYIPLAATIATLTFNKMDGTTVDKVATLMTDDRSIMSVVFQETESEVLSGGNFTFSLDINGDQTVILKGIVQNGLSRNLNGEGC